MIKVIFMLFLLSLISCSHYQQSKKVFGVPLRAETPSKVSANIITHKIAKYEEMNRFAMDPDCMWRPRLSGICQNPYAQETKNLEIYAAKLKTETLGNFDINERGNRDFAGLSQGHLLESLKNELSEDWLVDFAGDIYFSGGFKPDKSFTIADPLNESLKFSEVFFTKSGYMIAASSRELGADMRNPKTKTAWREEFQKIVLFSDATFDGARLDAWSTALIAGGKSLLEHLWQRPEFKDHWGYLYFNRQGEAVCSPNLNCEITKKPRKVFLPF